MIAPRAHAVAYVDPFDRVCLGLGWTFRPSATTAWQERSAL